MTKREQLNLLVTYFANDVKAEFARMLGITKQSLNTWFNHEHLDIEKVFYACPGVSAEWLITGEGEMLKPNFNAFNPIDNPTMKHKSKQEIEAIGLQFLRQHENKKLLSNVCVDCFVYGYQARQDENEKVMSDPVSRIDDWMESLSDRIKYLDDCAGYGGRAPSEAETAESKVLGEIFHALSAIKEGDSFKKYIEITQKK